MTLAVSPHVISAVAPEINAIKIRVVQVVWASIPVNSIVLLMTFGISLPILALAEMARSNNIFNRILTTFGRVPLFYFILQMFVAHAVGVILSRLAGKPIDYFFANFPDSASAPPGSGFDLWVVYAAWLVGLVILYPLCLLVRQSQTTPPRFSVQLFISMYFDFYKMFLARTGTILSSRL